MPTVARRFRLGPRKNNDFEAALSAGPELTRSTAEASALPVRLVCAGAGIRRPEPGLTDSRGAPAVGPDPISEGVRAARPGAAADGHGSRTRGSFELLERDHVLFGPWSLPGRPAGGGALFRSGGECDLASSHLTFSRISRPLSILTRASRWTGVLKLLEPPMTGVAVAVGRERVPLPMQARGILLCHGSAGHRRGARPA